MSFEMTKEAPVSLADLAAGWTGPKPAEDPPRFQQVVDEPSRAPQKAPVRELREWIEDNSLIARPVAAGVAQPQPATDGFELGEMGVIGWLGGEAFLVAPQIGAQIAELLIFAHATHMQQRYAEYGAKFGLRSFEGQGEAVPEAGNHAGDVLELPRPKPKEVPTPTGESTGTS